MSGPPRRFVAAGPLRGDYTPPPDKSISHRAAIVGAMVDEPVTVHNFLAAADTHATLAAMRSLGAGIDGAPEELVIRGVGLYGAFETTGGRIDVQNAGTLLRLLPGWLAGQPGGMWELAGDESIARRPVDRIVAPLEAMGARLSSNDGRPPLVVHGGPLTGAQHRLAVASAQVKSCVLLAGMLATGQTTVTEPHASRDHTERLLARARVPIVREGRTTRISHTDELEVDEIRVPGDPSSAAFLIAAAAIVPGSRIVVRGVGLNWTRTGFFRILERMGAVVLGEFEPPPDPAAPGGAPLDEPAGDLDVAAAPLVGTFVEAAEVPLCIDELPLVALLGCFAEGETVVRGAQELRVKESDRIAGVVDGLRGLGADIEATGDGFVVRGLGAATRGGGPLRGGTIDSRGDHRMAMLGAVAGLASERGVDVVGMEAAGVSYPGFEHDLRALLAR